MFAKIYAIFILVCFLVVFLAITGWVLELFYRRFISKANPERLWLNPGFLTGPYLPLYGFGVVVLYVLSYLEKFLARFDTGGILHYVIMFFIMSGAMTFVEYIAGFIFIRGMHIKLWDYSNEKWNIKGIICPKFSLIWGILSILYYFLLYPPITRMIAWFLNHQMFSFTVGTAFGVFLIDFATSMHLGSILRKKAIELDEKPILDFDKFKKFSGKRFFSIYNKRSVSEKLENFESFIKRSPDKI